MKNGEFYKEAKNRLKNIYRDIASNPEKQVSGLKKAKTQFKIPRIIRNREMLLDIILPSINQNKMKSMLNKNNKVTERKN